MPVAMQSTPVNNTMGVPITIHSIGTPDVTLAANASDVVTSNFKTITANGVLRNQNPPVVVNIQPGNLAFFAAGAGFDVDLSYAPPGGQETVVAFT